MPDKDIENSAELEWMLQNSQVDDSGLVDGLAFQYYSALVQAAFFILKDPIKANQAAQRTIAAAVAARHRYTGEQRLKAWLLSYTYAFSRKIWRLKPLKNVFQREDSSSNLEALLLPDNRSSDNTLSLLKTLDTMGEKHRLPVLLYYATGLRQGEIARVLNVTEKSLYVRFDQARQKLWMAWMGKNLVPLAHHLEQRALIRLATLEKLRPEEQASLDLHLIECSQCKQYAAQQAAFEAELESAVAVAYPSPLYSEQEIDQVSLSIGEEMLQNNGRKLRSPSLREAGLSLAVIGVVACLAWVGGLFKTGPPPVYETVQAIKVVMVQVTAPPPFTPTPAARRGANANAISQGNSVNILSSQPALLEFKEFIPEADTESAPLAWNNSGPISLAAALRFWGWKSDAMAVLNNLLPNPNDENVMPYELASFVEDETTFFASYRLGGDLTLIKNLIKGGFPVIVEKGVRSGEDKEWFGHYLVVYGFDDGKSTLTTAAWPDGEGSNSIKYASFVRDWRAFNYSYLVVYPGNKNDALTNILGRHASFELSASSAATQASNEIFASEGLDKFFAWFNRATSLSYLADYGGAAKAYDEAFAVYETLPVKERPWRMMWYQSRPYWAYYYTARYQDVVDLATETLRAKESPVLEESYYWRALAREALGDINGAIADLNEAVRLNPNFLAGLNQLQRLRGGT